MSGGGYGAYQPKLASTHEVRGVATENTAHPAGPPPVTMQPVNSTSATTPQTTVSPVPTVAAAGDDSTDALDEEWISKAKAIVEQTKHDPHMESMELSKVKAEYLRIRYNKHIKVAEQSK